MTPSNLPPLGEQAQQLIDKLLEPALKGMQRRHPEKGIWSIFVIVSAEESFFQYMVGARDYTEERTEDFEEPESYDYKLGINCKIWQRVVEILEAKKEQYGIRVEHNLEEESTITVIHLYKEA